MKEAPRVKIRVLSVSKRWPAAKARKGEGGNSSALESIDLEIFEGEFVCLLGPSGCGKTTLLNILAGFEGPSSGYVLIDGETVEKPHPKRITIFQEYALLPWRTVLGNVEFGLEMARWPRQDRRAKAQALLELVGLADMGARLPWELSGGMRQRVAVARSLAVDPDILFMDEPFGALDALTRLRMEEELVRIWLQRQKTVVFVTHDIDEAVYLADRVVVFSPRPGRIAGILPGGGARPRSRTSHDFIHARERAFAALSLGQQEAVEYHL